MSDPAVIIVGAGPVGLTAALSLSRRGIRPVVLEAEAELSAESRASTFHPPTLEMLNQLGLAERMLTLGHIAPRFQYRDRKEGVIAELDLSVLSDDTRFPFRLQLEQRIVARLLLERLREVDGADVRFGRRVVSARSEGGRACVSVAGPDGTEELSAPWVLAADGAHSAVRRSLGIAFEGKTYPERYLVLTLSDDVTELLPGLASINYVFDPEAWFVVLRTQDRWRVLFPVEPGEPAETASSPDRVRQRLHEISDRAAELRIEHVTLYNVHQRVAERLRVGRVVLAGDAAHLNNPLGGMGMNSGIHDAWLLAEPLAALCRGEGDEAALDDCLERRRQICRRHVLEHSDRNARMIAERDPAARRALHDRLRALAADRQAMRDHLLETSLLAAVRPELEAAGCLPRAAPAGQP